MDNTPFHNALFHLDIIERPGAGNFGDVMVVGGGISGIQASLDLATAGFKVYLVEKLPTIGGKMSQLDKTFPTNDCSMCIESPKFIECDRHPNIEILTYTEVDSVEGEAGDFTVTLTKKPRRIIEDRCTGCGTCVEYCPVKVPDPYNQDLSDNKAVHIYFSQAVPLVTYIDDSCRYLTDKKCDICEGVCKNEAIDLNQKAEKIQINVGRHHPVPGLRRVRPQGEGRLRLRDHGERRHQPRLRAAAVLDGAVRGRDPAAVEQAASAQHRLDPLRRLPAGQSRAATRYCSAVCCSYTQKQVILTKDHDADAKATIFHNDIRSYGKDFERFYQRAERLPGVRFIRSYVSIGQRGPGDQERHRAVLHHRRRRDRRRVRHGGALGRHEPAGRRAGPSRASSASS